MPLRSLVAAVTENFAFSLALFFGKIEYARLLKAQGTSLGKIAAKTGIPKTSLHRYLADLDTGIR